MRVEIRPIYYFGKALPKAQRLKEPAHRGKLSIVENRIHAHGRVVTCAKLTSATDGIATMLLPELTDVHILWLDGDQIRLRGNEQIDGVEFAQTWDVKVI
jgi:hypothetical protein